MNYFPAYYSLLAQPAKNAPVPKRKAPPPPPPPPKDDDAGGSDFWGDSIQ